jgi:hypothetical protein
MRLSLAATVLFYGCKHFEETPATHVVHQGETAFLESHGAAELYLAVNKDSVHKLAKAWEEQNRTVLSDMHARGEIFVIAAGTKVKVTAESFNERKVIIEEGPASGRTGWLPFDWLSGRPRTT